MKFLSILAVLSLSLAVQAAELKLTGDNTKIEWTGSKADGKHTGGFKTVTGTATTGDAIAFKVEIDCTSLHSDDEKLTAHLKAPDFFAVKDHPTAKFVSKKVEKTDKGYIVTGDLTLLGKTKEISFPATITATPTSLSLKAEFTINRMDYGMTYGKGKVHDDVALKVTVDAK